MSDTPQGQDWWQASDGKWYPPESHPSNQMQQLPPPPVPPSGPIAQDDKKPLYKRWWFIAAAVVVVIGVVAVVAGGGSDDDEPEASPSTESVVDPGATNSTEQTSAPGETPSTEPTQGAAPESDPPTESTTETEPTEPPTDVVPLPPTANPAIAAVGVDTLPPGEPGQITVIAQGTALDSSGSLPIVVRNMTDRSVARIEVTGTARDGSGALVGSGGSQGLNPYTVGPGEVAFGYVYFSFDGVPEGSTFDLSVSATDAEDDMLGQIDLIVAEHNATADSILVGLRNDSDEEVSGPIGINLICFDDAGTPTESSSDYTDQDSAPPGATVTGAIEFYGDPVCGRYLLAGAGWSF